MAPPPVLDARDYRQLLDEALARIEVTTPEWTNFNHSDPGVTLVELFAFLTEALVYRANQIPDRSRRKFLSLLGVPVAPASSARGIVAFANERGPLETTTVDAGLEVAAGRVQFRTELGLDVLPVEARAFVKRPLQNPSGEVVDHLRLLYASHRGARRERELRLYETTPLESCGPSGAALAETADGSLWIALLLRETDRRTDDERRRAREQLAGRTLNLALVPVLADPQARAGPGAIVADTRATLYFELPQPPPDGVLPQDLSQRVARYRSLDVAARADVLAEPGIVQIALPQDPEALSLWANLDPLEAGTADFPPSLEDSTLGARLITWLRVRAPSGSRAAILLAQVNATTVSQRTHVSGELLGTATGEPDQIARLAYAPVVPGSVSLEVTPPGGGRERWHAIDDLLAAGAEVPVRDPLRPPGTPPAPPRDPDVFAVDEATGEIRFGDGLRGRRPPAGATLRADYDHGTGAAGNVAAGAISSSPALPAGTRVSNPIATWGGADAEGLAEAERQASRRLQHHDRLVSAADFETIVRRAPGVQVGRIEVLPTFNPLTSPPAPTPGAVTLLVLPLADAAHPDAPEPDRLFLDAICRHVDARRLVTTEVFLRGPRYVDVWVSLGIEVEAGRSAAVVRDDVRRALRRFLAPIDPDAPPWFDDAPASPVPDLSSHAGRGWPLGKAVSRLELVAVAARVPGVRLVSDVRLATGASAAVDSVPMTGLELPRVRAIAVGPDAVDPGQARRPEAAGGGPSPGVVPVPFVPEAC